MCKAREDERCEFFLHFKNPACRLSANHSTELLIVIRYITNCRWLSQLWLFFCHKPRCLSWTWSDGSLFYEGAIKNHDKKEKLWKTRSPFTEFKSVSSVAFPRTEKLQSSWHQNPRRMIFLPTFNQNFSWYPKPLTCFNNFVERLRFSPCAMTCPSTIDFTYNRFHSRCIFEGVRTQEKSCSAKQPKLRGSGVP